MKSLACVFALSSIFASHEVLAQATADLNPNEADVQFSRIVKQKDGATSYFLRTPSKELLEKLTYQVTVKGTTELVMKTIYRIDRRGNPLGCQIYDGKQTQMLFKSRYAYDQQGLLCAEQMFDARVKHVAEDGETELPVRSFIYTYDANGKQNKPIAIVHKPGKTVEEVYTKPTALEENEFKKTLQNSSR